jgi:hypothetical protein
MRKKILLPLAILLNILLINCSSSQFSNFVSRDKDKLMDGNKEYRFISFNIPNLHYIEDYLPFDGTNPWRLSDEYEIRDALTSIKQLGGKVARMYVLSVKKETDTPDIIRHVEGPGKFNEDAFKTLDKVMQIANEVGVRLIIPFIDNWHWWGGPKEYAAFRGKERDAFWTDPQLISDFKQTVYFLVNRKNTFTGTIYKDDKALLAWETGNELLAPYSWTKEIAAYIKNLDNNHLVMEGKIIPDVSEEAISDSNIDIVSTHHYRNTKVNLEKIINNQNLARGHKPYIIGEYGIVPTQEIRAITDTIINQNLTGGMVWSLRFRNREGGFYHHYEYNNTEAYRWPGFQSGDVYDERNVLNMIREKAYQIDGKTVPPMPVPEAPVLLDIKNVGEISWQGSTGARVYSIERKEEYVSDWQVIANDFDDSRFPYRPLFSDETAEFGKRYFYRVKAKNESGESDYSNIVGPIMIDYKKFVDELEDFSKIFQKDGELKLLSIEDIRKAKEERNRLTGSEGSYIIYKAPQVTTNVKIDFFPLKDESEIKIFTAPDTTNFSELTLNKEYFKFGKNDYGFFDAARFSSGNIPNDTKFIKVVLGDSVQISRIEFTYNK